jgi:hypothetical protein
MGGSSRAKVIGALNSLIGGLTGRSLMGPKVLQGSRQVFSTLVSGTLLAQFSDCSQLHALRDFESIKASIESAPIARAAWQRLLIAFARLPRGGFWAAIFVCSFECGSGVDIVNAECHR